MKKKDKATIFRNFLLQSEEKSLIIMILTRFFHSEDNMEANRRPENMERITTPELASAFIEAQIAEVRAQVKDKRYCWHCQAELTALSLRHCLLRQ